MVDLNDYRHIQRELLLIKVSAKQAERAEIKRLAEIFRGRIIDVSENAYMLELTGAGAKLDAFIRALDESMILEVARSGALGVTRGDKAIQS